MIQPEGRVPQGNGTNRGHSCLTGSQPCRVSRHPHGPLICPQPQIPPPSCFSDPCMASTARLPLPPVPLQLPLHPPQELSLLRPRRRREPLGPPQLPLRPPQELSLQRLRRGGDCWTRSSGVWRGLAAVLRPCVHPGITKPTRPEQRGQPPSPFRRLRSTRSVHLRWKLGRAVEMTGVQVVLRHPHPQSRLFRIFSDGKRRWLLTCSVLQWPCRWKHAGLWQYRCLHACIYHPARCSGRRSPGGRSGGGLISSNGLHRTSCFHQLLGRQRCCLPCRNCKPPTKLHPQLKQCPRQAQHWAGGEEGLRFGRKHLCLPAAIS